MLHPPAVTKMAHALTLLEQWRNVTRQMLIDSLDTDTYAIPDALSTLNVAHEQAKGVIARYLLDEYMSIEAQRNMSPSDEPPDDPPASVTR